MPDSMSFLLRRPPSQPQVYDPRMLKKPISASAVAPRPGARALSTM